MSSQEQEIINSVKNREKAVFEGLYKDYYKALFALAFRYVRNTAAAEEIVHDVFLTIWRKAEQITIQSSLKSYLFRAVLNTSLNVIRKEKNDQQKQEAYMKIQCAAELLTEDDEQQEVLLSRLEEALSILPPKCREVMYLSRFGKMKQQEIADQMQISVKTVKNHLTYGFQRIREHMGNLQPQLWFAALIFFEYLRN